MNKKFLIIFVIVLLGVLIWWVGYAFVEPAGSPPSGNVPAPINVGPIAQTKVGDLEVANLLVGDGLTLGGVRRTEWPDEVSGCDWEGTKCDCVSETASIGGIKLTVGSTCEAGRLTDFKIVELDISSRSKRCGDGPPTGCTAGLYSRINR